MSECGEGGKPWPRYLCQDPRNWKVSERCYKCHDKLPTHSSTDLCESCIEARKEMYDFTGKRRIVRCEWP